MNQKIVIKSNEASVLVHRTASRIMAKSLNTLISAVMLTTVIESFSQKISYSISNHVMIETS